MLQKTFICLTLLLGITASGISHPLRLFTSSIETPEKDEVISSRVVRPGVTYYYIVDKRGPWRIQLLEIDLTRVELEVAPVKALDRLFAREQTSSMALRRETMDRTVIAALNGDFFSLTTGENENNNLINGEFVKGTKMTGSPFDTFDNIHSQFALSMDRKPFLDRFAFVGKVFVDHGISADIFGVNDAPQSNSLVLFNHFFGSSTPTDTLKMAVQELSLREVRKYQDTIYAIVEGRANSGGSSIGSGTLVLSGYNMLPPNVFSSANVGDTVRIWLNVNPFIGTPKTLIGGWPRIVLNGRNIGPSVDAIEGTFPSFSAQRNPRSGVGFSRDSTTMYFIAVDGRQKTSAGMTLTEFADLMISQGVYQGLNLDGGGSTTFVLENRIMNLPSDGTGERAVGNCLILTAPKQK